MILGGIGLFFLISFFIYRITNSAGDLVGNEPISFWDQDFKTAGIFTVLLVVIGIASVIKSR